MKRQIRHNGFSLTEVLIATGILALGLVMIAMAFPVGVKLASIATERPVGVVAGKEAFAKMRLYGIKPFSDNAAWSHPPTDPNVACTDYWLVYANAATAQQMTVSQIDDHRCYPSLVPQPDERRYYWSALVRRANENTDEIQATVFVCRMLGMGSTYYDMDAPPANMNNAWPVPVKVSVNYAAFGKTITVGANTQFDPAGQALTACRFFTEGCTIVEDKTGNKYKVMETRDVLLNDGVRETLILDQTFPNYGVVATGFPASGSADVWVVPPAIGSSRNPCIDIVQTILAF